MAAPDIPEVVDLYAVEPEGFVAARTELVRRLRADGRRPDATVVAKLRRPSPGAWALDRVAVEAPELLESALAAGAALREAMEQAVSGDASALKEATRTDRAATDAVVDAAAAHLGGRAAALRTKLAATVRAAVLDDEVADDLRRGVLAEDHDAPGFGLGGFAVPDGAPPAPRKPARAKAREEPEPDVEEEEAEPAPDPLEVKRAARERRQQRERLETEAGRLAARARSLARAADKAEAEAAGVRAEADAAQVAADAAADALDAFDDDDGEDG